MGLFSEGSNLTIHIIIAVARWFFVRSHSISILAFLPAPAPTYPQSMHKRGCNKTWNWSGIKSDCGQDLDVIAHSVFHTCLLLDISKPMAIYVPIFLINMGNFKWCSTSPSRSFLSGDPRLGMWFP